MTERTFLALTIYNGTGLVRERRKLTFTEGGNVINFTDVASSIKPETVKFVSLTDPDGTRIIEQNYVYDLVSSEALFLRFIDHQITITSEDGTIYHGKLLSADHRIILQIENGQLVVLQMDNLRDVQFPSLPDGLITRPTLRWLIFANQAGEHDIELTYLTDNITWNATYNLLLGRDNQHLDLHGWITIANHSGATYHNCQLKCIAGEINIIVNRRGADSLLKKLGRAESFSAPPPENVEQRDLFEYKLYDIPFSVSVGNNETKQIEFITTSNIPVKMYFISSKNNPNRFDSHFGGDKPDIERYSLTEKLNTTVYLEFSTDKQNGVDADLPAGDIRVYQEDIDGSALLIGENKIQHTPKGEKVNIYLGKAFDIVGERTQTHFRLIGETVLQESFEIKLRNRKESETVEVRVPERLFRWSNWEILNTNMDYTQKDSSTIEFLATIPPRGEVVITYTVQYSW